MPNRILRDAILTSELVCSLGWAEEVFYRRLMSIVDDYGRCEANPQLLRSRCYPLQTDAVRVADITRWLAACHDAGLILVYVVLGKQYLEVSKFGQQQRSASKFPQPPESASKCYQAPANEHLDVSVFGVVSEDVKPPRKRVEFDLPDWIPADTWAAYLETRKSKRAKNEPHALGLIVKDLEQFRSEGHDPVTVLNNSIKSGWSGVFKPKHLASVADIARITVPSKPGIDPMLAKLAEDDKRAAPPSLEVLAQMAEIRKRKAA